MLSECQHLKPLKIQDATEREKGIKPVEDSFLSTSAKHCTVQIVDNCIYLDSACRDVQTSSKPSLELRRVFDEKFTTDFRTMFNPLLLYEEN